MKESAIPDKNLTRSMVVEGATRGIYESLRILSGTSIFVGDQAHPSDVHISLNFKASSGGTSTAINPFAPDIRASLTAFSSP